MKLHIKRSQADVKGMFGGHKGGSFTLSLKLELSPEETSLIEKYAVWHYPLWERGQLPVTIRDLVTGDVQTVTDVERLLRGESIAKRALDQLPPLFEVLRTFGGTEVISYPRAAKDDADLA